MPLLISAFSDGPLNAKLWMPQYFEELGYSVSNKGCSENTPCIYDLGSFNFGKQKYFSALLEMSLGIRLLYYNNTNIHVCKYYNMSD